MNALVLGLALSAATVFSSPSQGPAVRLETPQERIVGEHLDAFNTGDADKWIAVVEKYSTAEALKRRTTKQRLTAYTQARQVFDKVEPEKIIRSSAIEVVVASRTKRGTETWWSFAFDPADPLRVAGVDVKGAQ